MKAVVLRKENGEQAVVVTDVPRPKLTGSREVLIQVLAVGIDGTDRDIIQDGYGLLPAGSDQLIIGHEVLGRIVEAGADAGLSAGELVTILVRRPCGDAECMNCREGCQDYCTTGRFTERGIFGADGFMCEFVVEDAEYVVPVPDACAPYGVLIEPQSIIEKVWNQVSFIQQRLKWKPKTALVTGSGPLGILAAATCRSMGIETHVWSRSGGFSLKAELVRECGATYHRVGMTKDSSGAQISGLALEAAQWHKSFDIIFECSGHSPLTFDAMQILNAGGVLALLSVTPGSGQTTVPSDLINMEMMTKNKCVIGSVNASRTDFKAAIVRLREIEKLFPSLLARILTQTYTMEQVPNLDFASISVKAVVDIKGGNLE